MKFLFGFLTILSSFVSSPDSNGWVAVEKPSPQTAFEHAGDEDDPSIWVLFSKRLGAESFVIRFPEDPEYKYLSPQEMEIFASRNGESYRLTVLEFSPDILEQRAKAITLQPEIALIEANRVSVNTFDFLYQKEGKWFWERLLLTPHHLYQFQTKSDVFQSEGHHYFIQSFDV